MSLFFVFRPQILAKSTGRGIFANMKTAMKKSLLLLLLLMYVFPACAQRAEKTFYGEFLDKTYTVKASVPKPSGRYDLEIEMQSIDDISPEIYFIAPSRSIPKWTTIMKEVKETFLEWRQKAIENDIKQASKIIKKCSAVSYMCMPCFRIGEWHKAPYSPLSFVFQVKESNVNLVIATGRIEASNNGFIRSAGGVIILSSEKEINDFISCFEEDWVRNYYDNQKQINALFE